MTNKPTGPAAAAREIRLFVIKASGSFSFIERIEATNIEAIILKHCPEDNAVEGLVRAHQEIVLLHDNVPVCYGADGKTERLTVSRSTWVAIHETAKASLAEYEKVKR